MKDCTYALMALAVMAARTVLGTPIVLTNNGMQVHILQIGATLQRVIVPNQDGVAEDVVLGYDDARQYEVGF